jgi:hypothetical protein
MVSQPEFPSWHPDWQSVYTRPQRPRAIRHCLHPERLRHSDVLLLKLTYGFHWVGRLEPC